MLKTTNKKKIKGAQDASEVFIKLLQMRDCADRHKEMFYVMGLSAQNYVLFIDLITMGTVNYAAPVVRECFRFALIKDAVAIILCHNHPSGIINPSPEDETYTRRMKEASLVLGVKVLDHVIVNEETGSYYSFAEDNKLT